MRIGQGHQTKAATKQAKIVQKMSENCFHNFWTIVGHFSDNFSTFFGHFVDIPFSGLSNDLPVTNLGAIREFGGCTRQSGSQFYRIEIPGHLTGLHAGALGGKS